jgi:predicted NBD/HSP70 family sugar kinase
MKISNGTLGTLKPLWDVPGKVREIASAGGCSSIAVKIAGGDISLIDHNIVRAAAAKGDRLCSQLMAESFDYIGKAVVNIAYLLNPEVFFFEPWTASCEECTLDVVRRHMKSYGVHNWKLHSEISAAKCGYELIPSAAAELPVENLLRSVRNVYNNGGSCKVAQNLEKNEE